ncbi:LLM class F420-dependent oxidoreductase [Streptomyces caniscabiei]|uniref:LLM class F420-dependent oxidoreductase n=1 Tax=Streptomyces caniscabiei TaxID=2746961 RepID=UPI001CE206B0|nr:LLM class F420-dependent oxidoreductase [Streptomyces caniscabiei]MDX3512647.1 LLM class F420-dependent oxidoreductase [Streptomyces caniscabiei]MDX3722172.1 LLM class F420-dependent oxidoreductase [Streptomyces caniscabiei]MDX3730706.1 LLM class F420-dependent oxidoreductase [Streptomyces caniscabiei]WEO28846.1 LLM class F420-dependent oxidoreductase [Streptomyces caniscabiei]
MPVPALRLGLNLGYWVGGNDASNLSLASLAEDLGLSAVWVSEAYGSDAVTVMSWIAARTSRIDVGSAVLQIPARSPAMTAMTAATLDTLSGGRLRLGLGVSGPQVSEGWHGVRFASPLGRTREYVGLVRRALRREPLAHAGRHFTLPLPDGPGKALALTIRPPRERIPVYLAALGPRNLELTGEIADGWLPVFFSPEHAAQQLRPLTAGLAKSGRTLDGFDIAPGVPLVTGPDWRTCARRVRGYAALYLGGMGGREDNHYTRLAERMGFGDGARAVQERFLAGDYPGAMAAVPLEFLDATSLLGPRERIAERMTAFAEAGATTLNLMPVGPGLPGPDRAADALRVAVEAAELAGLSTAARVPDGPRPPRPHDAPDVHDVDDLQASQVSQVSQGETRTHDHA